jgi:autotransporter-associated beta strand protein
MGNLTLNLANGFDLNGSTRTILVGDATYNANALGGVSQLGGNIRTSSGTAGLTKTGIGTLLLSGTNTYNGNTTVNEGILQPNSVASLPGYDSAGKVVFNGGTLGVRIGGSNWTTTQVDTLLINATKTSGALGIDTTNGNLTQWTAFTTTNLGSTLGLNKFGVNTLILDQANTYNGGTTVSEGTLALTGSLSGSSVSLTRASVFVQSASGSISGSGTTFTHGSTGVSFLSGTNTYTGGTTISAGSLAFAKIASMPASGAVAVQTNATLGIGLGGTDEWTTGTSGNGTLGGLLGGLGGQSGSTVSYTGNVGINLITTGSQSYGVIGNVGSSLALTKSGTGTLTLTGTNTYTGATTLNAGTLKLNYDAGAGGTDTSKLANATLNLNGGTLELSGGSHLEAVSGTNINNGTTFIKQTNSGTAKLSMGNIGFSGGAVDFAAPSIATTSSNNATSGILSLRLTVAGSDYAAKAAGAGVQNIVAYTGYTAFAGTLAGNTNYSLLDSGAVTANQSQTSAGLKINTSSGSQSLALSNNISLTTGSILFTGAHDYSITTSGTGRITPNVLLNYGAGTLTLGSLGATLNQYGTGKTILSANAGGDYSLNVFGGTVQFSSNAQIGTGSAGIALSNGTLIADSASTITMNRTVALGSQGGTLDVIGGGTLTVSGVISGLGNPLTIGSGSTNGTVSITNNTNTYANATNVVGGTLIVNGNISTSVLTTVQTGATLGGSGTVGSLTIDSGGFFSPGNSPGTTTVNGNYVQNGSLIAEVTGLTAGTQHDQVIVNGTATLNGLLSLTMNTFTPVENDLIFLLLNDGTDAITGTFTGFAQGAVVGNYLGKDWKISYNADSTANTFTGTLNGNDVALMAVPEPRAALLGGLGVLMLFRRRR